MSRLIAKIASASALLLTAFAAEAAMIGGPFENVVSPRAADLRLVQYYGGIDPRSACQDAGGRYWGIPQLRVKVSEARPAGPGLFEMTVWAEGRQAICVADTQGRIRNFSEAGGGPGPGPYPGPGPGPYPGPGPGPGYGRDPGSACQDAGGRYWGVPQARIGVSQVRPMGGGNFQVTIFFGSRGGICIVDAYGQVQSFNER
ncbi:MAG TPA: hypothetical protein VKT73_14745 [Xanthobacteraceae bacterium]|nr:hypothetical protein [Xanthobacteraceae bacterium]